MKKHVVIVTLLCCNAGYWIYQHFAPCAASVVKEMSMKIMSPAFEHQTKLPIEYTCHGKNVHPPLSFYDVPENAKSLVLVMSDPDAPQPNPWIHWVLFNIPPTTKTLDQSSLSAVLSQAKRGKNTAQTLDYYGACPPRDNVMHHYHFMVYALDTKLDLPEGSSYDALKNAMQNHIIAQADLVGLYEHP